MTLKLIGTLLLALPLVAGASDVQLEKGREVYNYRCYFCHGYSGDAKTLAATYLSPPPANFRAAKPEQLDKKTVLEALKQGRPGTAMKAFSGILSEAGHLGLAVTK